MQSKEYANYAREVGRISVAVRPADTSPARESAALACFHLRRAEMELERARDRMAMLEAAGGTQDQN